MQLETNPAEKLSKTKTKRNMKLSFPGRTPTVSTSDRMFFTEQLALLLETGESLYGALTTMIKQTENPRMRDIIGAAKSRMFIQRRQQNDTPARRQAAHDRAD